MLVVTGAVASSAGWMMMLAGLDGTLGPPELHLALALVSLGGMLLASGIVVRVLEARVDEHFERLLLVVADAPANRRALEMIRDERRGPAARLAASIRRPE